MGLIKCVDCGAEISTQAPACPRCGRPSSATSATSVSSLPAASVSPPKSSSARAAFLVLVLAVLVSFPLMIVKPFAGLVVVGVVLVVYLRAETKRAARIAVGVIGGMWCLVLLAGGLAGDRTHKRTDAPTSTGAASPPDPAVPVAAQGSGQVPDDQKKFIAATIGYLQTVNEQDTVMAKMMTGASTGTSSLADIRASITGTRAAEEAEFRRYESVPVPSNMGDADKKIHNVRDLHETAFTEILQFWVDEKPSHIKKGTADMKRAAIATNETISDLTAMIRRMKEEMRK